MTLHELQIRLHKFDIIAVLGECVQETKEAIADLNRGQLFIGKRTDGTDILPDYSDYTIELKQAKGQPYDRVTLRDKGHFWNSIHVDVDSKNYSVDASDSKTDKILDKYETHNGKILGLSKESKSEEYIPNYLFPALKAKMESMLGLKFG